MIAMILDHVRLRRRRYLLLRVADETALDLDRFLRGEAVLGRAAKCWVLCPITGKALPVTADELAAVMAEPAERWRDAAELLKMEKAARDRLVNLARRGILIGDPPFDGWEELATGEEVLEQAQWLDLAAVYHAHSSWDGVIGTGTTPQNDNEARNHSLKELLGARGDPPRHFVERTDAQRRIPLHTPALNGTFFDLLLTRRTTRAFRTEEPLALAALEKMLYAVFGTHGIKHLAPGVAAIKRTSPSGGGLHPIEAYVLAMNVADMPTGLYHYETGSHSLAELRRLDTAGARELAVNFTAGQTYFAEAHALVVHVARFERFFWKYARHRKAYKAVLMDSGHLSQTFYLTAAHLGLGAFYTAAINDADISRCLHLVPGREAAIAINGVGLVATDRDELHFVPDRYLPHRAG